jgi:hypothetical protein
MLLVATNAEQILTREAGEHKVGAPLKLFLHSTIPAMSVGRHACIGECRRTIASPVSAKIHEAWHQHISIRVYRCAHRITGAGAGLLQFQERLLRC